MPSDFVFVEWTPKNDPSQTSQTTAHKRDVRTQIRGQAARSSAKARLETIRVRTMNGIGPHGQRALDLLHSLGSPSTQQEQSGEPMERISKDQDQEKNQENQEQNQEKNVKKNKASLRNGHKENAAIAQCFRDRDASVTVHAHQVLGGSIPESQADIAILGRFLQRFRVGSGVERPWVQLVMTEYGSATSRTTSLRYMALQANATALCANDLQQPEMHRHATKKYLSTITLLQSELNSPRWHHADVMYTCMILTLFECIQSNNPSARRAHVSGVASLIQQRGPEKFKTGLEHTTFRYFRINILMMALVERRPSFLAEPAWKTVPFSGDCPPKTMLDLLVDILLDIPAVLATLENFRRGELTRFALIQKALELVYWVRYLTGELEQWKETWIWTYPAICTATPQLQNLGIIALCELATGLEPYDVKLGEALNCYNAAHLVLARIALGLANRSFIMRNVLVPPYSVHDLVAAIVLLSRKHISASTVDMVSMVVTTFTLKVAQSTTEVDEPALLKDAQHLLDLLNASFNRRFNINYSVSNKTGEYER